MKPNVIVKKAEAKRQIVYAEVYAPLRLDSDKEFMTAEDIMDMAYAFMRDMKQYQIDHAHTNEIVEGACVVESFIVRPGDPDFIEGSWVVGVHVPDPDDWAKVEDGTWNGFSMEAEVMRVPTLITITLPPVLTGTTMGPIGDAPDHTHKFMVGYTDDGDFMGGKTDPGPDGHVHFIYKGTVTEDCQGHNHRFSHLDDVRIDGLS